MDVPCRSGPGYKITETKAPDGYGLPTPPDQTKDVDDCENATVFTFEDPPCKCSIEIKKKDKETGEALELTGAKFTVAPDPYGGAVPHGTPYGPTATKEQELNTLKSQAEYLEDALDGIKKRISEVEAESEG